MQNRGRAAGLVTAALTVAVVSGCSATSDATTSAARSSASAAAVASSAENARPGTYGKPVDPSLPNPTNVATDAPATTTAANSEVPVSLTYSGWNASAKEVLVGGFVPGVVETGGNCTLTLTKGDLSARNTTTATPTASSTSCGQMKVPGAQLSSGVWTAFITYRSPAHHGTSRSVEVTIP